MIHTIIEDTIPFDISFSVTFKKNDLGELIPSYSRSDMSGFISGYEWELRYADIDKLKEEKYSYTIGGSMHWYLFGIEVYSQRKIFEGIIE